MSTKRTTLSLPEFLDDELKYISSRLGLTKSALVSSILLDQVMSISHELKSVPELADESPRSVRARGKSKELVEARLRGVLRIGNDLLGTND